MDQPWLLPTLKQINTRARNLLKNNLKRHDITDAQLEVLLFLNRKQGESLHQREVERELRLSNPTIVSLLDKLEEKGLAKRVPCQRDRRKNLIHITEKGIAFCDSLFDDFCAVEALLLQDLSSDDAETLASLLKQVWKNIGTERMDFDDKKTITIGTGI